MKLIYSESKLYSMKNSIANFGIKVTLDFGLLFKGDEVATTILGTNDARSLSKCSLGDMIEGNHQNDALFSAIYASLHPFRELWYNSLFSLCNGYSPPVA